MRTRPNMRRRRTDPSGRSTVRLCVFAVLIAGLSLAALAGPGIGLAAASESVTADRTDASTVTVDIEGDALFETDDRPDETSVTVVVDNHSETVDAELNADADRYAIELSVRNEEWDGFGDATAVPIDVERDGEIVGTDTADFRYVALESELNYDSDSDTLRIGVDEAVGFDSERVTLEATWGGETETFDASIGTDAVSLDRAEFDDSLGDHTDEPTTFRVTDDGEDRTVTSAVIRADFRLDESVAFADGPIWTDEDTLFVPLEPNGTYESGESFAVEVSADGVTDTVRGTVENGMLEIDRGSLDAEPEMADGIEIDVVTIEGSVTDGSKAIEPELRLVDSDLVLWYPLLESGTSYTLSIDTDEARYVRSDAPSPDGSLDVPQGVIGADDIDIALTTNETTIELDDREIARAHRLDGTIEGDDTVVLDVSLGGLDASEIAIVGTDSESTARDGRIDGRELTVSDTDLSVADRLLVSTAAGLLEIHPERDDETAADGQPSGANESSTGDDEDDTSSIGSMIDKVMDAAMSLDSLLLVPALFGSLAGIVIAWMGGNSNANSKNAVASGIVGLGLATFALLIGALGLQATGTIDSVFEPSMYHAYSGASVAFGGVLAIGSYVVFAATGVFNSPERFTVNIEVVDNRNQVSVDGNLTVKAVASDQSYPPNETTITDGNGYIKLREGPTWTLFTTEYRSNRPEAEVGVSNVRIDVDFPIVDVSVYEEGSKRDVIKNATVEFEAAGVVETKRTGTTGSVQFEPPKSASSGRITVSHDRYHEETVAVETLTSETSERIALSPRTGDLRIRSSIGGVPTGEMDIQFSPEDEFLSRRIDTSKDWKTDEDGEISGSPIIGAYSVELPQPDGRSYFEGDTAEFRLEEGETTTVDLDASFTWTIADHEYRISRLRTEISQLSEYSGRDGAVPAYYGSVVEATLDAAADDLPASGHRFFETGVDPEPVANAMLLSAAEAVEAITAAMTTKRNIDLFAACSDLADPAVSWTGHYDIDELFEWLEGDLEARRDEIRRRFDRRTDEVKSAIERRRQDYSELEPVRAMLDRVETLVSTDRDDISVIVTTYTALQLLDAIESLFDHDELCERLSRTVF